MPRAVGQESLPVGIVLRKQEVENRWIKHRWRPVAVIPGAPELDPRGEWRPLHSGSEDGKAWWDFHAGTLKLDLFRKETGGYLVNLAQHPPRIWIVLREGYEAGAPDHDYVPVAATVCPYEAQDFLDSGEDLVDVVVMPDALVALVQAYVDEHHVEEEFYKRKRKQHREEQEALVRRGAAPVDRRKPKKRI